MKDQIRSAYKNGYEAALSSLILHYKLLYGKGAKTVPIGKIITYLEKALEKSDQTINELNLEGIEHASR